MNPERWHRLSPLLDSLFELPPELRVHRLRELREEDSELAADLESLIALEVDSADFLSTPLIHNRACLPPGTEVGPYKLERLLGEGGMGQVWLAARADGLYQRRVALKLLRPGLTDANLRLRFTRERQILARLEHPHIARLLNAGVTVDGLPYLALEYVDGEPITNYCRELDVPLSQRLRMFQQVCEAVSHAHANLIVHRDLKPSNILVTPAGEVRLLDFGIAKLLDTESPMLERTRTGVRTFTLHYAAPEQIRGEPVTTMTDVYSLGVVLYELLTDHKPYRLSRESDAAWEEAILAADPPRPSQSILRHIEGDTAPPDRERIPELRRRARMLSGDLDNIVLKTLSKRPEQRYPSVEALALDLRRYEEGRPVMARPQSVGYRVRKYVARHRWALITTAAVTLVLAGSLSLVAWQANQALAEAARAQAMQEFMIGLFEQAGGAPEQAMDLRSLLAAAEKRDQAEPSQQPRARAELLGMLARLRLSLGDYPQARTLLDRQAALVRARDNIPPSLQLESLTLRGQLLALEGRPQRCVTLMVPALSLARGEQAQLPPQVSEFYSQLGRCHHAAGKFQGARQMFERSLAIRRQPPVNEVGIVENLIDLASLHAVAGENAAAMRGLNEAMAHLQSQVGARHALGIEIRRNRCALLCAMGRVGDAERECRDALDLALQLHGAEHRASIQARRELATVHASQGRFAQAQAELAETHGWLVARLGPDHEEVARNSDSLGVAAWERGDFAAALPALEHAVAIWRRASDSSSLAASLFNQARVLREMEQHAQAMDLLQEARRLRVQRFGAKHALVGDTDRLIGEVAAELGQDDVALASLRRAVELTRAGYGAQDTRTRRAELALAREQANVGDANAVQRLSALANASADSLAQRRIIWLARAYTAQVHCQRQPREALRELDAVRLEMEVALPEGAAVLREVARIQEECAGEAAAIRRAR